MIFGLFTWSLATVWLPAQAPGHSAAAYWASGIGGAVLLLACLLAHELAHAVVARREGIEVEGLTLWMFGGVASLGGEAPTAAADLRIAIVGPATSLALAAGFGLMAGALATVGASDLVVSVAEWLAGLNLLLGLFNLVPGAPLDGGRVLRALLWRRHGDRVRAALTATRAGRMVAFGLIGLGLVEVLAGGGVSGLWLVLIGWFVFNAARAEEASILNRCLLAGVRVGDVMSPEPKAAPGWLSVDAFIEDYVLGSRHSAYPVARLDGRIQGLVSLAQLRAVAPAARMTVLVADVAIPLADVPVATTDEDLVSLLSRLSPATGGRALVFAGDKLVGIVTPADVSGALERMALRSKRPHPVRSDVAAGDVRHRGNATSGSDGDGPPPAGLRGVDRGRAA
ncbi:MAG: site-2 protease family protein [Actinomycetota bacterium]|nr:site-2 protease family protein [Actinomycetota bacterium]